MRMQTRSRLVRWRIVILGFILAAVILVGTTAVYQNWQFMAGWAAFQSGDYATAFRKWRPLAEHGHVKAQHNIGSMYLRGEGVPKDYTKAEKWTRKAAEQGRAVSQYNLGWLYANGRGVPQDYAEAAKWYRMAAEQNESEAQTNLGIMYLWGQGGVPQDDTEAHKWFSLAATQGLKRAVELRDDSAKKLTPAQLAEAQQLAREWMEEHGQTNAAQRSIANAIKSVVAMWEFVIEDLIESADRVQPSAVGRTVLLGTWWWDVESDSQGRSSRADVWWEQVTRTARYLTPKNGAQLALLRGADYDSIGLKELQRARYSGERLSGSDSERVLRPGTVVAMKTAEGNYAKLKVLGYRSAHDFSFKEAANLRDSWKSMVRSRPDTPNYHLEVAWSLYR